MKSKVMPRSKVFLFLSHFSSDSSLPYFLHLWEKKNMDDRLENAKDYVSEGVRLTWTAVMKKERHVWQQNSRTSIFCVGALEACLITTKPLALSSTSPLLPHCTCFFFVTAVMRAIEVHWCVYLLLKNITLTFNRRVRKDLEKLAVKQSHIFHDWKIAVIPHRYSQLSKNSTQ